MKSRVVVTILVEYHKKYLLGKKPKGVGPYPDTWHFPGGGVSLGEESIFDAVKREIKEETGLTVRNIRPVIFDEDHEPDKKGEMTHYLFLVFKADAVHARHQAGDDIHQLQWFTREELMELPLTRPGEKFFREYNKIFSV